MKKVVESFTVISNEPLNSTNSCLTLQSDNSLIPMHAGQFTNVEVPGNLNVFLRRPFSIFEVDYDKNRIKLLIKVLGKGSLTLTKVTPGMKLSMVYPLGRGWTLPIQGEKVLAFGGGSGVAPVLYLAKQLKTKPENMHIILGAKSAEDHLSSIDYYSEYATLHYTTDDGSLGVKGFVTNHPLFDNLKQFNRIYACGPLPMMKTVASKAKSENIFCEVSLENVMPCGIGVCLCCIEPTVKGNLCVCTDGPVFNINDLKW